MQNFSENKYTDIILELMFEYPLNRGILGKLNQDQMYGSVIFEKACSRRKT